MADLRDIPGFMSLVEGLSGAIAAFDNKELAFAIALLILLASLGFGLFLHWARHRPWVRPIRRLTKELGALPSDSGADQRLARADEIFHKEPKIEPLWIEYRKHLTPNPRADGYLNLVNPRLWFSLESLPGRGYEHWCSTWAGVFLTVGLLFTFIGLSAALLKVGGIDGADSAAMKAAITGILGVSSAKFLTSIAGLIPYIAFSLIARRYQSSQHRAAAALADAVQHLSLPLTPELLLHEQGETARKQLHRLEHFDDALAVALDAKLGARLNALSGDLAGELSRLREALPRETATPIVQSVGKVSEAITKSNREGMEDLLHSTKELAAEFATIKGGMGDAWQQFGKDIKEAANALTNAGNELQVAVAALNKQLEAAGQKAGDALGAGAAKAGSEITGATEGMVNKIAGVVDGLSGKVASLAGRLAAVDTSLNALPDAVAEQVRQLKSAGEVFEQGGRTVTSVGDSLRQAAEPLRQTAEAIQAGLSQVRDTVDRADRLQQESQKTLGAALDKLKEAAEAAHQTFETHEQRFGQADEALVKVLDNLRSGITDVVTKTQEAFGSYQEHITAALGSLGAGVEDLREVLEDLADIAEGDRQ